MKNYVSITGGGQAVDFETAVLQAKAIDGGLFVPANLPSVSLDQLWSWKHMGYPQLACEILALFINRDLISKDQLEKIVFRSFQHFHHNEIITHRALESEKSMFVQELFHGPSLSFKDVAMGFVVNLFEYLLSKKGERRTIMVATSGDTGPAAACASEGKAHLDTWLLYPDGMITEEQRRQMSTIAAENVHTIGALNCPNGSDDLDAVISHCFADHEFKKKMNLSSVNSINWARIMMQTAHYFYAYLQLADHQGEKINFSVPSGGFGNLCAGSIARRMGLPVGQFVVASNANGILSDVFNQGLLRSGDLISTHSSAIDICWPINFWRHVFFSLKGDARRVKELMDIYDAKGKVNFKQEELYAFSQGYIGHQVSDETTLSTIKRIYDNDNYLLDPHGAVAVTAAQANQNVLEGKTVCLLTAHPCKFPHAISKALGQVPEQGQHPAMQAIMEKEEMISFVNYETMKQSIPDLMINTISS